MANILDDGEYESDIQSGSYGEDFQKNFALALFLRMRYSSSSLRMGYEVKAADKFDDIVLFDDGNKVIHFIQIKCGSVNDDKVKSIDLEALFPTRQGNGKSKGDFDLSKYLESYLIVNNTFKEPSYEKKFYILSNKDLKIAENEWVTIDERKDVNEMLRFPGSNERHIELTPTEEAIKYLINNVNKDFIEVKEAIKNLFLSETVPSKVCPTLKNYSIPLRKVLTIDKHRMCSFLDSFNSKSEQFSAAHLYEMLMKEKFDMTQTVTVDTNFLQKDSRIKYLPPYVSEEVVVAFFRDLTLLVGQPNDYRPVIDLELQMWMRTWVQPDIFGKITKWEMFLMYTDLKNTFEELNKPTVTNKNKNKRKHLLQKSDIDQCLMKIANSNKKLEGEKVKDFHEFYINRRIVFKEKAEQLSDESITEEDAMFDNSWMELENTTDITMKDNHNVKSTYKNVSQIIQKNPLFPVNVKCKHCYQKLAVDRQIYDTEFVKELQSRFKDQQFIVLVADPGMGKTRLLKFLAFEVQQHYDVQVFLVHLIDLVKKLNKIERISDFNGMMKILEAVLSKENCDSIKNAPDQRDVGGYSIALVMDGFDEIHSKYTMKVIDMLKQLGTKKSIQIVISARMHVQKLLEHTFGVESMFLEPFSEEDQINYLRKMWNVLNADKQRFKIYSEQLLETFHSSIPTNLREICGLPLMMRMLGEIHADQFERYLKSAITNFEPNIYLPIDKFNIAQIYEQFIRKCFHFKVVEKHGDDFDDSELDSLIDGYILEHQLLAMKLLDIELLQDLFKTPNNMKKYEQFRIRCETESEKSVLVKVVNGAVQFCCLSFSEYFVAKYLCDNIFTLEADHILRIWSEHEAIRKFSMMKLEEHEECFSILNNMRKSNWKITLWACESGCSNIISSLKDNFSSFSANNRSKLLQDSAKNGYVMISKLLLKNNADPNYGDEKQYTALHLAACNGHITVVELLLQNHADVDAQQLNKWTALHLAAKEGHDQVIRLLINAGAITNSRTNAGQTPLHIAATNGHRIASELFIDNNNDVNAVDDQQWTALHLAASNGHLTVVEILLRNHALENAQNYDGWTALQLAAKQGHDQVIRLLINAGAITNSLTNAGQTLLHIAASNGHRNASEVFIVQNNDVNAVDDKQWTALHLAASNGHVTVVELLLLNHADVNAQQQNKWTALHLAAKEGHDQIIRLLINAGAITESQTNAGQTPLHIAAASGHRIASELFIDNNNDVNAVDGQHWTALHLAASKGHLTVVEILLLNHALEEAQNVDGWTALHLAAKEGHDQVIRLLINARAFTNSRTNAGQTPLHIAAASGHRIASELFICNNNDVNAVDDQQWTALHLAASNGHVTVVELLLRNHAYVDAQQQNKWTALHLAAKEGDDQVIRLLINAGAITNSLTNTCRTPLHIAAANGHKVASELFIVHNNDVNAVDDKQWTALHLAASDGHVTVVKLLLRNHAYVDAQQQNKWTALHLAASKGHDQVIVLLIKAGAITNSRTNSGKTPLHIAAANGHRDASELFILNNNDVNTVDDKQWTALHSVANYGHITVVELLLRYHANVDALTDNKLTALHLAVENGHDQVMKILIFNRASMIDVNDEFLEILRDLCEREWKIALWVCESGCLRMVSALKNNLKRYSLNKMNSILDTAAKCGFHEIYNVLKEFKKDFVEDFDFEQLELHYINRRIRFEAATFESTHAPNVVGDEIKRQSEGILSHEFQKSPTYREMSDTEFVKKHKSIFEDHQHILLVAEPGIGKTSLLQFLEFELQKQRDVDVFLMHFSDVLEKVDALQKIKNVDDALNILKAALSKVCGHNIATTPVQWNDKSYSIILLLDGFDEIHEKYTNRVIEMLQQLSLKTNIRFIMSSRVHNEFSQKLKEGKFNAMLMLLEPLSNQDQISYLRKMWSVTEDDMPRFVTYSTSLLEKFYSNVPSNFCEIPGLFPMLTMLAEVNSENFNQSNGKQNYTLNILELCEQFVKKCFNKKFLDQYQHIGNIGAVDSEFMLMDFILEHQFLAMKLLDIEIPPGLFKSPRYKKIYKQFKDSCEKESKKSLLMKVVNKNVQFRHRFYSEYFVAKYMCDHIFTLEAKLISSIISAHDVIRRLLMIMLEETDDFTEILNDLCKLDWRIALKACESGCLANVSALTENFQKFSLENLNTMLQVSAKNGYSEICEFLIAYNENLDKCAPLHAAVENSHFEVVKLLLSYKTDVNCQKSHGRTPLHVAALNGHTDILQFLMTNNADINAVDEEQRNALHLASKEGPVEIIKILLDWGVNTDLQAIYDETPLHIAALNDRVEIAKLLIDRRANVNLQDKINCTPLHLASEGGHLEIARLLIDRSANVNPQDASGCTPLHLAIKNGYIEMAVFLIENGADVNLPDASGCTPLLLAIENGYYEIADILIKIGEVNQQDEADHLDHLASEMGNLGAEFLKETDAEINLQDEADYLEAK